MAESIFRHLSREKWPEYLEVLLAQVRRDLPQDRFVLLDTLNHVPDAAFTPQQCQALLAQFASHLSGAAEREQIAALRFFRKQGHSFPQRSCRGPSFHQVEHTSFGVKKNHGRQHAHTMHRRTGQAAVFFPILHGGMSGNRDKLHVTHIFIQRAAFFRARLERFQPTGFR